MALAETVAAIHDETQGDAKKHAALSALLYAVPIPGTIVVADVLG